MKLKSVVASMLALGVASSVALAAGSDTVSRAEFDAMKDQVTKMEAALNQNQGGIALQNNPSAAKDWFNRVTISGQVGVDAFSSSNANYRFQANDSTNSAVELPVANLFVDAQVNDWVKAHAGLHFHSNVGRDGLVNSYLSLGQARAEWLDEAYVTVGNFAQSPFYVRAGRQYIPFGSYKRFDVTPSLTQLLTQTNATALQAGFVMANGVHGAVYTFNGTDTDVNVHKRRVNNFGVNLGLASSYDNVNYQASVGYLYNLADVNYIKVGAINSVDHVVGGLSADASIQTGPFDASLHYVTALRTFGPGDVNTNGIVNRVDGKGAKPAAWGVDAGYGFDTAGHASRLGVGYQRSSQATNVGPLAYVNVSEDQVIQYGMPKERYLAQYTVNVWTNTDLGFQLYHDRDYKGNNSEIIGTANKATTGVVRLTVNFV